MNKIIFSLATILVCSSTAINAYAEEVTESGSVLTDSGAVIEEELTVNHYYQELIAIANTRAPKKLQDITMNTLKQSAWETESATIRERQWEHRIDCREAIRRSNRDQILSRASQCFRSDLLLDVNFLRKQLQYIATLPLIDEEIAENLHSKTVALIDAEMAIVDAIDAKLFSDVSEMEAAKKNLRQTYREPYWVAVLHMRTDRQLLWTALTASFLEPDAKEEGQIAVIQCLLDAAKLAQETMKSKVRSDAIYKLQLAHKATSTCTEMLHTFMTQEKELSETSTQKASQ